MFLLHLFSFLCIVHAQPAFSFHTQPSPCHRSALLARHDPQWLNWSLPDPDLRYTYFWADSNINFDCISSITNIPSPRERAEFRPCPNACNKTCEGGRWTDGCIYCPDEVMVLGYCSSALISGGRIHCNTFKRVVSHQEKSKTRDVVKGWGLLAADVKYPMFQHDIVAGSQDY